MVRLAKSLSMIFERPLWSNYGQSLNLQSEHILMGAANGPCPGIADIGILEVKRNMISLVQLSKRTCDDNRQRGQNLSCPSILDIAAFQYFQ